MNEIQGIIIGSAAETYQAEELAIQAHIGVDPSTLGESERVEYDAYVAIVSQFSRINPATGQKEIISPSRLAAIPAITARHCRLQYPSRGSLSTEQILYSWRTNMPTNDGTRHPDDLFDCAQWNFGTDADVFTIERSVMQMELERRRMIDEYMLVARTVLRSMRWELPLNTDIPEEAVEEMADRLMKKDAVSLV